MNSYRYEYFSELTKWTICLLRDDILYYIANALFLSAVFAMWNKVYRIKYCDPIKYHDIIADPVELMALFDVPNLCSWKYHNAHQSAGNNEWLGVATVHTAHSGLVSTSSMNEWQFLQVNAEAPATKIFVICREIYNGIFVIPTQHKFGIVCLNVHLLEFLNQIFIVTFVDIWLDNSTLSGKLCRAWTQSWALLMPVQF